jgi:hypothetical protein
MRNIYRSLLLIIAGATQKELARQVRNLKVENQILRSKLPARVPVTEREKNRLPWLGAAFRRVGADCCHGSCDATERCLIACCCELNH